MMVFAPHSCLDHVFTIKLLWAELNMKKLAQVSGQTTCACLTEARSPHSDIDKNYTLKVKVQTAYKLTFEVGDP